MHKIIDWNKNPMSTKILDLGLYFDTSVIV